MGPRTLALLVTLTVGCGDDDAGGADADADADGDGTRYLVVNGDYVSGSYGVLTVTSEGEAAYEEIGAGDSDPQARVEGDLVFVVGRTGSNLTLLDPDDLSVVQQFTVADEDGAFANPHDVCVVRSDKAYVPRYEQATLAVVDPSAGALRGTIDLAAFGDADGIPEMESCTVHDSRDGARAYVAVQRLDRDNFFEPVGESTLAVIEAGSDSVLDMDAAADGIQGIPLIGTNPFGDRTDPETGVLCLAMAGSFLDLDGGIECVDLEAGESDGFLVEEEDLGGNVGSFVLVAEDLGAVIVADEEGNNALVRFDPRDGTVGEVLYDAAGFVLFDVEAGPGDWLVIADRTAEAPGIQLVHARTGEVAFDVPLDTGLPPSDVAQLP